jgi:hypothetical protein
VAVAVLAEIMIQATQQGGQVDLAVVAMEHCRLLTLQLDRPQQGQSILVVVVVRWLQMSLVAVQVVQGL